MQVKELVKCEECNDTGLVAVQLPEGGIVAEPCLPCNMKDYVEYINEDFDEVYLNELNDFPINNVSKDIKIVFSMI